MCAKALLVPNMAITLANQVLRASNPDIQPVKENQSHTGKSSTRAMGKTTRATGQKSSSAQGKSTRAIGKGSTRPTDKSIIATGNSSRRQHHVAARRLFKRVDRLTWTRLRSKLLRKVSSLTCRVRVSSEPGESCMYTSYINCTKFDIGWIHAWLREY